MCRRKLEKLRAKKMEHWSAWKFVLYLFLFSLFFEFIFQNYQRNYFNLAQKFKVIRRKKLR